ncbi:MAG: hypothetical protein KDJ29_13965 [Hyphomicrobiales bacterium]|nr:hypothetical protein [Hyphomicrobiales bacterium]
MSDRPILFSAPMVRALLEGRKTQTRRVLKRPPPPDDADRVFTWFAPPEVPVAGIPNQWAQSGLWADQHMRGEPGEYGYKGGYKRYLGPLFCRPGDRLWVKETWRPLPGFSNWDLRILYAVDDAELLLEDGDVDIGDWIWPRAAKTGNVSPLFMPRWASRLTLTVTEVRVQRVQDISHEDALAEGCRGHDWVKSSPYIAGPHTDAGELPQEEFEGLWNSLNEKRGFGWDANPWVVALTFTVEHRNIDQAAP